jgi:hypothetical protein
VPTAELVRDHEADVVPVAGVLAAGVPQADDKEIERRAGVRPPPEETHR